MKQEKNTENTSCLYALIHNSIRSIIMLLSLTTINANASPGQIKLESLIEAQHHRSSFSTELKLYVFNCGEILVRDITLFAPALTKGEHITFSDTCYLIEHPNGTLVWDTGLSDSLLGVNEGIDVGDGAFNFKVFKTLKSQFEEIDKDPLTVDYIAFSHLHLDHTANAAYFLNATWLIQENEYDIAFSPDAEKFFFNPSDYAVLQGNETVKLNGHFDVFGDKSVVIISTPGHTPGHQMLYLNLPETGPVILSGDLYHFQKNREEYGFPVFNTKKETVHSFALIDELLEKLNAKLWIQHDKPFFESLNLTPAYYK
jgi:N-acyl homoserine lactone hydrolase